MHYLVLVFKEEASSYGVMVPDLPGCFSGGDTLEDALSSAKEGIECHIEGLLKDNDPIPQIHHFEYHRHNPEFADGIWAVVEVKDPRLAAAGG